jgi:hypothetical protein
VKIFSSTVHFDEYVPQVGILEKSGITPYNGMNSVTCQMGNNIGDGHHSCTSCETWEKFVIALKNLLEIKGAKINQINKNKQNI